ncbi:hypothetical protein Fleli_1090 [Bernardetia litoralis DSM 6794]|uniref:Uncharacterized protein n=1 Tax=Bernardetia litoralis (strain ATCC 23117 / DSM 6794 / NBRC 15988 / NCIMB 1366 / Fx l1 / Sio-4) TaxID=880071 RepID=I4AHU3_BERLS|nr:hypothetical protein [Bernardetia litoralis]AFM03528.1 hypothetical protein Fleli_1090 [Bernardetia litoralis DSM 6794]
MENYTLNYHKTFLADISKGLQAALDTYNNYYIEQAIYAFGSPKNDGNAQNIKFATPAQNHCFTDYVLLEQQVEKQKIYERYLKEQTEAKEIPLLNKFVPSFENSYTSLFRIVDIDVEEGIIYFDDVLGVNEGQEIAIVDKVLADTIDKNPVNMNFLMFFRFIPFLGDFIDLNDDEDTLKGMTNGYIYFFEPQEERTIIKEYKKMAAKVRVSKSSSKRQIAFTELDKKYGKKLLLS